MGAVNTFCNNLLVHMQYVFVVYSAGIVAFFYYSHMMYVFTIVINQQN